MLSRVATTGRVPLSDPAPTVTFMRRVVFDTNAIDPVADTPGAYETLKAAVQTGTLDVMYTHVTIDELVAIPDPSRRARLVLVMTSLGRIVPTGQMVVGFSRLNFCRVGGEEDGEVMDALRSGSIDHTRDALIASTARFERCALVTNERRLANRSRARGIEVLTTADLLTEFSPPQSLPAQRAETLPVTPDPSPPTEASA